MSTYDNDSEQSSRIQAEDHVWNGIASQYGTPGASDCKLFEDRLTHLSNAAALSLSIHQGEATPDSKFDAIEFPGVNMFDSLEDVSDEDLDKLTIKGAYDITCRRIGQANREMSDEWKWKGRFRQSDMRLLSSMMRPTHHSTLTVRDIKSASARATERHTELMRDLLNVSLTRGSVAEQEAKRNELLTSLRVSIEELACVTRLAGQFALYDIHAQEEQPKIKTEDEAMSDDDPETGSGITMPWTTGQNRGMIGEATESTMRDPW